MLSRESESNAPETRDVDMLKSPYQTEIFKASSGGRGGEDEGFHIGEINGRRSDSSNKELQVRMIGYELSAIVFWYVINSDINLRLESSRTHNKHDRLR